MKKGLEGLVRLGYLAKALVYILVGVLALRVAAGMRGGRLTDPGGALSVVLGQPFGTTMLFLVAIGLLTYSFWRIAGAILGWQRHARKVTPTARSPSSGGSSMAPSACMR